MTNNAFTSASFPLGGPYTDAIPITPSDEEDLPEVAVMLWARGYRTIRVTTARGTIRDFSIGDTGTMIPIGVKKVWATGTVSWSPPDGGEMHALVVGGAV